MKKFFKKARLILSAIAAAAMVLTTSAPTAVFAARTMATAQFSSLGVTINGEKFDMHPAVINGVSYFPVRTIGVALNCKTDWQANPKKITLTSQTARVNNDDFSQPSGTATAVFDTSIVLVADGREVDTSIAIIDNRSYIPLKQIAEAMGKRATWYEDTRTIDIVNPQTATVDSSIKDYYVYDLPQVTTQEDYLVGNWRGYSVNDFSIGTRTCEVNFFITKNSDGTYKVISRAVITDFTGHPEWKGKTAINELKGEYNSSTKKFTTAFAKDISYESPFGAGYSPDEFVLEGDVLNWISGGRDDFQEGMLTRF